MSSQLAAPEGNTRHLSAFILLHRLSLLLQTLPLCPGPLRAMWLFAGLCWAPPAMELGASIALKEKETAAAGSSATRITKGARRGTPTASPVGFPRQEAKGWFAGSHALRCALAHEKELDPEPRTGTAAVAAEHSGGWGHGYVAPALTGTKVE